MTSPLRSEVQTTRESGMQQVSAQVIGQDVIIEAPVIFLFNNGARLPWRRKPLASVGSSDAGRAYQVWTNGEQVIAALPGSVVFDL